ncbi:glycosyltransferase family 39 protein [Nocardioides sp. NPDC092400]|uniref:glycosyltransferase family 39 protein n=1 Tax=Nocardioides sp. NPDC092400 TaxID=3155196 RepID=UPI003418187E
MLDRLQHQARWVGARIDSRWTVAVAATLAFLLRLPGLTRPLRPDEAGFTLVARSWDPRPDSVYGDLFVDRHPLVIAVFALTDRVGGEHAIRVLGAVACVLAVLAAAAVARRVASERAARWTAVAVAALLTNTVIDAVAVKGEILALPFLLGSIWLALEALERHSAGHAFLAGLLAATALGMKQSLVGGLAFGAVLLVAARLTGRLDTRTFARLAAAAVGGVAVPVLATVTWALAAGVHLEEVWYTVYGFRTDATAVLGDSGADAPAARAATLAFAALAAGMLLVIGGFLVHVRREWRADPVVTAATVGIVVADGLALALGGSYWRDYLFGLVPATALCAALLARHRTGRGRTMRVVIGLSAVSSLVCLLGWAGWNALDYQEFHEADTGTAIAAAAEPGDTLVVFGGRADLQLSSGLATPYPHLWSLPMRTLDHGYGDLRTLVEGPDAPTWLVAWVPWGAWGAPGAEELHDAVRARYERHGTGCSDRPVYLLRGLDRPALEVDC